MTSSHLASLSLSENWVHSLYLTECLQRSGQIIQTRSLASNMYLVRENDLHFSLQIVKSFPGAVPLRIPNYSALSGPWSAHLA